MPKYEFIKDALEHLCESAFETAIFKEHCLINASVFCSQFKILSILSVSLTTDFRSKAIMDPSSVQLFSNIVSVTDGGLEGAGGTLLLVLQYSQTVWYGH